MRKKLSAFIAAVIAAAALHTTHAPAMAAQDAGTVIDVAGAAGDALELALNGGKIGEATSGADGSATFTVALGTSTRQRVTVWVDRCVENRTVRVQLVVEGQAEPPADEGCDRTLAGWFWSNARRVTLDVARGTVSTPRALSNRTLGLIGAGVAAGGLAIAAGSGGSGGTGTTPQTQTPGSGTTPPPFSPAGSYQSMTSLTSGEVHAEFINLLQSLLLSATVNSPLTIAGPAGSNWVTVTGDYDATTSRFVLTGRGTVAGFSNVGVRFEGTITTSGALSGNYTMGTGGELPGGQATVYAVTGQKQ